MRKNPRLTSEDTGCTGLTQLYPWPLGPNLLANASFERTDATTGRPTDWTVNNPAAWNFPQDDEAAHGTRMARLIDPATGGTPTLQQQYDTVAGWFTVRGQAKTENVASGGARIAADRRGVGATAPLSGTYDWTLLQRKAIPLTDARRNFCVESYQRPTGVIHYDDVGVHREIPPLAEGFLLYPNYRGYVWTDGPQEVRVQVHLSPTDYQQELVNLRVRLFLETEECGAKAALEVTPTSTDFEMRLDVTEAKLEPLLLCLQVFDGAGKFLFAYPSYSIRKITPQERSTFTHWIDTDGVLVRHNQRIFVIGMYDTGPYSNDPDFWDRTAHPLAEAGCNMYLNYWMGKCPQQSLNVMMSAFGARDISFIHTINNMYPDTGAWATLASCEGKPPLEWEDPDEYVRCRIRCNAEHPWYAGQYTMDERDADKAPRVFAQYQVVMSAWPAGVCFLASNKPHELVRWRDVADASGTDSYPVRKPAGQVDELEQVAEWNDGAREATFGTRPLWPIIQFFQTTAGSHWPTAAEIRAMSYMGIVGGAHGVWFWSYGSRAFGDVRDPELRTQYWQSLCATSLEVAELAPLLISQEVPDLFAGPLPEGVRWRRCKGGARQIAIVVNHTPAALAAVPIGLARPVPAVSVLHENRVLPVQNGTITDSFAPYGVHIYDVTEGVDAQPSPPLDLPDAAPAQRED